MCRQTYDLSGVLLRYFDNEHHNEQQLCLNIVLYDINLRPLNNYTFSQVNEPHEYLNKSVHSSLPESYLDTFHNTLH